MTEHSPEVQRLLDRQAILDCLHRYTRGLDRHDDDSLNSAFHPDGLDEHGAFTGTIPEFLEFSAHLHSSEPWTAHTHFLDCNHIDFDGDVAHAETYVLFVHRRDVDSVIEFGGGRYIDRFERRNGDWRIAARRLVIEWSARAEHVVFADVAHYPRGTHDAADPSYLRPFELRRPDPSGDDRTG
jgi:hypothetical protein